MGRLTGTPLILLIQRKQIIPSVAEITYQTVAFSQSRHHLAYRVAMRCPCPDNVGVSATFNWVDYIGDYVCLLS